MAEMNDSSYSKHTNKRAIWYCKPQTSTIYTSVVYTDNNLSDFNHLQYYNETDFTDIGIKSCSADKRNVFNGVTVYFKKLNPKAVSPMRATDGSAGWDLTACSMDYDISTGLATYFTGIAVSIPKGYVGLLFPRSSICKKTQFLTNSVGVIDSDYRGEILLKMRSVFTGHAPHEMYSEGERVGQLIIMPAPKTKFVEVEELDETLRGTGGYGSTGN